MYKALQPLIQMEYVIGIGTLLISKLCDQYQTHVDIRIEFLDCTF